MQKAFGVAGALQAISGNGPASVRAGPPKQMVTGPTEPDTAQRVAEVESQSSVSSWVIRVTGVKEPKGTGPTRSLSSAVKDAELRVLTIRVPKIFRQVPELIGTAWPTRPKLMAPSTNWRSWILSPQSGVDSQILPQGVPSVLPVGEGQVIPAGSLFTRVKAKGSSGSLGVMVA